MAKWARPLPLVLLSILTLALSACGGGGEASPEEDPNGGGQTAQGCDDVDLADAPDEPVTINYGRGLVADEPLWVLESNPDVTEHQGVWYEVAYTPFRSVEDRFTGYQAGELQAFTGNPPATVRAVASGLDISVLGSVMRESHDGFVSRFLAREDSGIEDIEDLEGARIGIFDIGSATDLSAKSAVARAGLDYQTDAEYVVLPPPAMVEAIRSGQIDVGIVVEPFYTQAMEEGGLVEVFDAVTGPGIPHDVQWIVFDGGFIDENLGAVCAFLDDVQSASEWYVDNLDEARTQFVEQEMTPVPLEVFLAAEDWYRPVDLAVSEAEIDQVIDLMVDFEILSEDQDIPASELLRPGVTIERP